MDRIPGADTLGFGFDFTKKYDPSSTTQRIFKEGRADDSTTTIGKSTYSIPQNIGMEQFQKTDGTSVVYSTRQQVQEHFAAKAGITASGFGFKGHVEASYAHVSRHDRSYYYALVEASQHAYTLKLKEQRGEWFTNDFASDVKDLPATFNKETEDIFFAFFGTYGTHYVHQVQLGGSLYYYVAVEKTASSDETTIKAKMDLEYKGLFAKAKAEAESSWESAGKDWANSRTVRMVTYGGENLLDGIAPSFKDWKGEAFAAWTKSLIERPGVSGFNLTPISNILPLAKRKAGENALRAYLRGGLVVRADRDYTPAATRHAYYSYPTIEGPDGQVPPPSGIPEPPRREVNVGGMQVVLFDTETFQVIHNRDYYLVDGPDITTQVERLYKAMYTDLGSVRARDYYCALSVFGVGPMFVPSADVAGWLFNCGAKLTEWQKYTGATSSASGMACYTFAGRKGMTSGGQENFVLDPSARAKKLDSTTLYFLRGAGVFLQQQQPVEA